MRERPVVLVAALGCGCLGGANTGPCAHDSLSCGDGTAFVIDEECELDDALLVRFGQGEHEFVSLLPGGDPDVERSRPGIDYLALALRIDNADADHLVFDVEIDLEAIADDGLWTDIAHRHAVYSGNVVSFDGSAAEILGIVVVPKSWTDFEDRRITIDVRDTCARRSDLVHAIDLETSDSSSTGP